MVYPFASLPRVARERGGVTIIEINADTTPLTGLVSNVILRSTFASRSTEFTPKAQYKLRDEESAPGGEEYGFFATLRMTIRVVLLIQASLTEEGVSDYIITGKTGDILPRIVEEVSKFRGIGILTS